ncbi:ATP-dependent DNA ligase [Candidatus Amesbacteria bacterium]|nr:ATP-dependent DNA ligase [Candidatus Amesbacteria bacterium]
MYFKELAEYLEKLEGTNSRLEMTRILARLFAETTPEEARLVAYMTQGKLGPAYRSPDFGVADKMMIRALGGEAERIFKKTGDLGKTVEEIKSQKSKGKSTAQNLKVKEVYEKLREIAEAGGEGSQERKIQLVGDLLDSLGGRSAKYAVKMILGKLRTGFSDMTVLDALSWMIGGDKKLRPAIERMYNVRADLGEIAEKIKNQKSKGKNTIQNLKVEPGLGTPVLMARAERAKDAVEIWTRLGECAAEYKLDGLRIQAHVRKSQIVLFSRGLENVTSMYPDVVEGLAKQIKHECIVEGEMIAVGKTGKFLPFQETVQRKRKYQITEMAGKIPLTIYVFDLLWANGANWANKAYLERRKMLEELTKMGRTVKLMPMEKIETEEEIERFFKRAVDDGCEGIIAKKLDGEYAAGARNFNWIKYKKSYDKSNLADTIDAVVMGYDAGQGKRAGFGIGDFLIGVYDSKADRYLTAAKIGTGLTDEEWRELRSKVQDSRSNKKPENYEVTKQMECDFWVGPKYVVEIKADEITRSPMHTSGLALRFPRFVGWREKKPEEATSLTELKRLYTMQGNTPLPR